LRTIEERILNFLKAINGRVHDCEVLSIVSLLGAVDQAILASPHAEGIIDAL
jgi:hypothetical protein